METTHDEMVESSTTENEAVETTAVKEEAPAASEATAEASKEPAVTEGASAAPKKDAEARIRQLVARQHESEREAAYWKGRAESTPIVTNAPVTTDTEPRSDNFATYDEYVDARAAWRARQEFKTLQTQEQTRREQEDRQRAETERTRTFSERVDAARTKYDDFDEVAFNPVVKITKPMMETLQESEFGTDLAYYFGKNPSEAERISKLTSPLAVAREIGKLETKLTTKPPAVEPKRISAATEPVTTVTGKGAGVVDENNMTTDEWMRMRNEQLRKRRA